MLECLGIDKVFELLTKEVFYSYLGIAIETIFLFFVVKEFKMTRKSFDIQEEELKNRYCHEVWHVVGDLFFYKLFRLRKLEGINEYIKMIVSYGTQEDKLNEEIENKINNYLNQKHENFKKEDVTDNYKEVFETYKEIVLTIVKTLSIDLYNRANNNGMFFQQADEMMRMLEGRRYLILTVLST